MDELIYIMLLSIALAMDAFAVALSLGMSGLAKKQVDRLKVATTFGFFQGLLFVLGVFAIMFFGKEMTTYNRYLAAILLGILGIKMIKEALETHVDTCKNEVCIDKHCKKSICDRTGQYRILTIKLLLTYGTATSIDAFAAGVTYGLLHTKEGLATISIAVVTFVFSFIGASSGMKLKALIGNKANLLGGIILILLAIKSLI